MLAVGFNKKRLASGSKTPLISLDRVYEQIANTDLDCRMDMQFRLFDSEHAVVLAQSCDHDGHHLRYSDANIARSHENALSKITKRDFGPTLESRVQFLEFSNIIFV